jgi:hypothetical protein
VRTSISEPIGPPHHDRQRGIGEHAHASNVSRKIAAVMSPNIGISIESPGGSWRTARRMPLKSRLMSVAARQRMGEAPKIRQAAAPATCGPPAFAAGTNAKNAY